MMLASIICENKVKVEDLYVILLSYQAAHWHGFVTKTHGHRPLSNLHLQTDYMRVPTKCAQHLSEVVGVLGRLKTGL